MGDGMAMEFDDRMTPVDALMYQLEVDPRYSTTIVSVTFLDAEPDERIFKHKMQDVLNAMPRMRQRLHEPMKPALPYWEWCEEIDLDYHRRRIDLDGTATEADVLELASQHAADTFDPAHPLWRMTFISGLEGGRCAIIQRMHHAITDGVGGMKLVMSLMDFERNPERPPHFLEPFEGMPTPPPPPARPSAGQRLAERARGIGRFLAAIPGAVLWLLTQLVHPVRTAKTLGQMIGSLRRLLKMERGSVSTLTTGRGPETDFRTVSVPVADLKAGAKAAGCKLNDAYVAACLGALTKYHRHHGDDTAMINVAMPMNLRTEEDENKAGNNFMPARFEAPLDIDDPVERMRWLNAEVAKHRNDPVLGALKPIAWLASRLPKKVALWIMLKLMGGNDLMTSNVPGPPIPLYQAGALREKAIPFGPRANSAVNMTLMSQMDNCVIGLNIDSAAFTDADLLRDCMQEAIDEIVALGQVIDLTDSAVASEPTSVD